MIIVLGQGVSRGDIEKIREAIRKEGPNFKGVREERERIAIAIPDGEGSPEIVEILKGSRRVIGGEMMPPFESIRGRLGL